MEYLEEDKSIKKETSEYNKCRNTSIAIIINMYIVHINKRRQACNLTLTSLVS